MADPTVYLPAYAAGGAPMQGPGGLVMPILDAMQAYHRPNYGSVSAEEWASLTEQEQKLLEERFKTAQAYATGMNDAVKNYWTNLKDEQAQLVAALDAYAKNNMASADARRAASDLAGVLHRDDAARASAERFNAPSGDVSRIDQAAANHQSTFHTNWGQGSSSTGGSPVDRARGLLQQQSNDFLAESLASLSSSGGQVPNVNSLNYAVEQHARTVAAELATLPMSEEEKAALFQESNQNFYRELTSRVSPEILQSAADRRKATEAADASRTKMVNDFMRGFTLPPDLKERLLKFNDLAATILDPTDPAAYATMSRTAGDSAVSGLASNLIKIDEQLASINQRKSGHDDPFYATLREYEKEHPWFGTWMSSQGFRHPEEAARWLQNHPELAPKLDKQWRLATEGADLSGVPEAGGGPGALPPGSMPTPEAFRQQLKAATGADGKSAHLQTNAVGRMLDELAGLFRRPAQAYQIPGAPSGSDYQKTNGGGAIPGEFGQPPRWSNNAALVPADMAPGPRAADTNPAASGNNTSAVPGTQTAGPQPPTPAAPASVGSSPPSPTAQVSPEELKRQQRDRLDAFSGLRRIYDLVGRQA